jgi:hypothetical protein
MPPPYWVEALSVATYLLNRRPSSSISGEIPYARLFGRSPSPSYDHLRVFGASATPISKQPPLISLPLDPLHVCSWAILRDIKDIIVSTSPPVALLSLVMLCLMSFPFLLHATLPSRHLPWIFYETMIWILLCLALLTMQRLPRRSLHPPWMSSSRDLHLALAPPVLVGAVLYPHQSHLQVPLVMVGVVLYPHQHPLWLLRSWAGARP